MNVDTLTLTEEYKEEIGYKSENLHSVEVWSHVHLYTEVIVDDTLHRNRKIVWPSNWVGFKVTKEAALMACINIRTAQQYIKKYNDDEERQLLVSIWNVGAGRKAMLRDIHSELLVKFVDEHPAYILSDIMQTLCEAFPEFIDFRICFIQTLIRSVK